MVDTNELRRRANICPEWGDGPLMSDAADELDALRKQNDKLAALTAENERLAKRCEIVQADNDRLLCDAIDNLIVKDENESLRNRCSQLERLVCQSRYKIEGDEPCVDLMDMDDLECLDSFGTREAAIDAAILHMEASE